MNQEELQVLVDELKADGLTGAKFLRKLKERANVETFEKLKELMEQLPSYTKAQRDGLNQIIRAEAKKESKKPKNPNWGQKGNVIYEGGKPKDYAPNDYMAQVKIIRDRLTEIDSQIATVEVLKQEKRNLLATLSQILEDFGSTSK